MMTVVIPPVMVVAVMMVAFDNDHLIDVGHRREGVDRLSGLSGLGTGGTEADHTRSSTGQGEEFTAHIL